MAELTAPTLIPSELAENIFARPPGWLAFFALPEAFTAVAVRNSLGTTLDWARTTNGRYAVVYDPDGPLNSTHFTFVGPNGDELARVLSRCGGPDIGRIDLPPANDGFGGLDPVTARVLLTPERFCLVVDTEQQPFELIWHYLELGPLRAVEAPTFDRRSGAENHGGMLSTYLLPEAFPLFTVQDAAGATLGSVRSPDGRRLLVYDPDAARGPFVTATYRLLGSDGTVLATLANGPPDPCADAVPVAELTLPNPTGSPAILSGPARVLAAAGAMCVQLIRDGGPGLPAYAVPFGPAQDLQRPVITGIGTNTGLGTGGFLLLVVPAGWPTIAEVRNEAGAALFVARHPDGRHLLVYDAAIDGDRLSRLPSEPLRYTLVGASGAVLAVVSSADQPEAPTPSTVASGALPATGRPIGPTVTLALVAIVLGQAISRRRTWPRAPAPDIGVSAPTTPPAARNDWSYPSGSAGRPRRARP
ncbi:MAG: hypothetical protein AB7G23_19845 [Vicinamibacterales bacterium]